VVLTVGALEGKQENTGSGGVKTWCNKGSEGRGTRNLVSQTWDERWEERVEFWKVVP